MAGEAEGERVKAGKEIADTGSKSTQGTKHIRSTVDCTVYLVRTKDRKVDTKH